MVSVWWLPVEALAFMAACIYLNRVSYRCGVWDGAFNHFLPVVRREIMFYDPLRGAQLLAPSTPASAGEQGGWLTCA